MCCKEGAIENEEHALFVCQATGADKWLEQIWMAWDEDHQKVLKGMTVAPTLAWWERNRWMLRAAIIPRDTVEFLDRITSSTEIKMKFLKKFHLNLCAKLADLMHKRGVLKAQAAKEAKDKKDEEDKAPKSGPVTKLTGARKRREDVKEWIESHRHLVPTKVEDGLPTAFLVKLWEFDRKTELNVAAQSAGRKDGCFSTMLTTITKNDTRMAEWLKSKKIHTQDVTTVLWSVKLLPTISEEFWKEWEQEVRRDPRLQKIRDVCGGRCTRPTPSRRNTTDDSSATTSSTPTAPKKQTRPRKIQVIESDDTIQVEEEHQSSASADQNSGIQVTSIETPWSPPTVHQAPLPTVTSQMKSTPPPPQFTSQVTTLGNGVRVFKAAPPKPPPAPFLTSPRQASGKTFHPPPTTTPTNSMQIWGNGERGWPTTHLTLGGG